MKKPKAIFQKGDKVSVELKGQMRQAEVSFVNSSIDKKSWVYGLTTCDSSEKLKTVKDQRNWNNKGEWEGNIGYALISKIVREYIK